MKKIILTSILLAASTPLLAGSAIRGETPNLSSMIPKPFYEVQKSEEGKQNRMMVLNSGIASLEMRLDIIRKAKSHIEVEYFIYNTDESSKLLTLELVKAAKRGVKVRILVDKSAPIFVLDEYYAKALADVKTDDGKETDIELRYYNDSALYRLSSINFRNHRKLISVDDKYAITGGRNVGNEYYDMAPDFNFLDRDVYVSGDIVATIRESFDKYFEHDISERVELPVRPADIIIEKVDRIGGKFSVNKKRDNSEAVKEFEEKMKKTTSFVTETAEDRELREDVKVKAGLILSKKESFECPETTYSTDAPGGTFFSRLFDAYSDDYRFLRKTLFDKLADPKLKKAIISSPYMINNNYTTDLMYLMLNRGVDLTLYTNSLASTDAVYVAANLYKDFTSWTKLGIKVYVHDGKYLDEGEAPFLESIQKAMWGTHSKTQVYETENSTEVMIGTYNVDNRSNHYNSEMGLFCKGSKEISDDVKNSIAHRVRNSYELIDRSTAIDPSGKQVSIYGSTKENLGFMRAIAVPSWLLKFLL